MNPGVCLAIVLRFTFFLKGLPLACTSNIWVLPLKSGLSTITCRSNLPGLNNAGSKTSGLFVAAINITPWFDSNPSISTRSWFKVCSLSSWPPPNPAPRILPTASISSIKIIEGEDSLAFLNKSLTLLAPTPTNISTKSEPEML